MPQAPSFLSFLSCPPAVLRHTLAQASPQNITDQLNFLEGALNSSTATWDIVVGHHPVFGGASANGFNASAIVNTDANDFGRPTADGTPSWSAVRVACCDQHEPGSSPAVTGSVRVPPWQRFGQGVGCATTRVLVSLVMMIWMSLVAMPVSCHDDLDVSCHNAGFLNVQCVSCLCHRLL